MPIRSDRGRNATLRALATWPLYSPRRLLCTITVLVVLCVAVTIVASTGTHRLSTSTVTTSPSTWTLSPSTTPTTSSGGQSPIPVVAGDPTVVARRFAEAWIHKLDTAAWRAAIAPLCTDEFRAVILPTLVPDHVSAITGDPALTRGSGGVAEVTVPLDTMLLALTLHDAAGHGDWRISDAQPAQR
ncbi:hypothetical protein [Kibdelosporangium aridum]|uniref:Uncharacterized protein n=1 Tax=Kibdelosporangium aridum TaxID=2030 RepID=A0A1Y5Y978_KIBAR|nr:hypothetical protein [Kibdelosporangium aridum]SMD27444.1 hypothetical protein SAMN05661093_11051 [Kibdelosporangium aridum]